MPSVPATIIASSASSIVAGKVEPIRPATPRRKWIEVPKSPCSTWPAQIRYWRNSGWSSPISWRFASISASVAFGGSDIAAGSTGSRRRMQNSSAETMNRMTTETRMRRRDEGEDGGHGPTTRLSSRKPPRRHPGPIRTALSRDLRADRWIPALLAQPGVGRDDISDQDHSIVLPRIQPLAYFA